ncbi:hypothetical protein GCM10023354_24420 [Garicola koreensis]
MQVDSVDRVIVSEAFHQAARLDSWTIAVGTHRTALSADWGGDASAIVPLLEQEGAIDFQAPLKIFVRLAFDPCKLWLSN